MSTDCWQTVQGTKSRSEASEYTATVHKYIAQATLSLTVNSACSPQQVDAHLTRSVLEECLACTQEHRFTLLLLFSDSSRPREEPGYRPSRRPAHHRVRTHSHAHGRALTRDFILVLVGLLGARALFSARRKR